MISKIPIYQMTHGQDQDGNIGLVFTTEQDEYSNQSILFTIPIFRESNYLIDFVVNLREKTIFIPFEMDGEYHELNAEINFPEFIFTVPFTNQKITFIIDDEYMINWNLRSILRSSNRYSKYVGKHNKLIPNNHGFLSLLPVDLYEMDELYKEHKGVFVGLTPNFGNKDIQY